MCIRDRYDGYAEQPAELKSGNFQKEDASPYYGFDENESAYIPMHGLLNKQTKC